MRPGWDDAPSWAKWLAQDADGWWTWYTTKPVVFELGWVQDQQKVRKKWELAARFETISRDWRNTLQRRPRGTS